jgi:hypothetical protein
VQSKSRSWHSARRGDGALVAFAEVVFLFDLAPELGLVVLPVGLVGLAVVLRPRRAIGRLDRGDELLADLLGLGVDRTLGHDHAGLGRAVGMEHRAAIVAEKPTIVRMPTLVELRATDRVERIEVEAIDGLRRIEREHGAAA